MLLLRIVVLARNARSDQVSRYSALLLLGIAAYVVESAPGFGALDLGWRLPIHIVSCGTPAAFWVAMGAIFVDEFRPRWYHALAWLALRRTAARLSCQAQARGIGLSGTRICAPCVPATAFRRLPLYGRTRSAFQSTDV